MDEQPGMRMSDAERQFAVDRLKAAHDEGRLDLLEYDRRLLLAYSAVTDRDLDRLFLDLPVAPRRPPVAVPSVVRRTPESCRPASSWPVPDVPLILRILWINYAVVVIINVTVWLAVPGGGYFWPAWMLVPGVVLAGATAGVNAVRRNSPAR